MVYSKRLAGKTDEEALLELRLVTESGCWVLSTQHHGRYGSIRRQYAHRLAFETWVRPLLPGEFVLHHCDNPPCFNPAHLFPGSARDNLVDAALKGRWHPSPRRDECPSGHPLTSSNLYFYTTRTGKLRRECRECRRANVRRWRKLLPRVSRDAANKLGEALG